MTFARFEKVRIVLVAKLTGAISTAQHTITKLTALLCSFTVRSVNMSSRLANRKRYIAGIVSTMS